MSRRVRIWTVVAVVVAFLSAAVVVLVAYGGLSFWPALVTEFAATVLAVIVALEIEGRRDRAKLAQAVEQTTATRSTEARKRLLAVRTELEKNQTSIREIRDGLLAPVVASQWQILHPQLLDGAWSANGERLGDLVADYELVSDLSTFYGRLEELRWRIRYRTEARNSELDGMTAMLAHEMRDEVAGLLERVTAEERAPEIRPVGLVHVRRISDSVTATDAVALGKTAREDENAS